MDLAEAVRDRPVILDGGLATQLEHQGHDLSSALWSARLLRDHPDAIVRAHRAFVQAGAEVATTASYQASFDGLGDDAEALMRLSVTLARDAGARWVAASVGPYGATLADGSEYRGDYDLDVHALRTWHRPRLEVLADTPADVLAVETIPCLAEVEALCAELAEIGRPAWLSVSAAGGRTRAGEPLADAFAIADRCPAVIAVGVNCLDPREVPGAARAAAAVSDKPVVAYPNGGQTWDAVGRVWAGPRTFSTGPVSEWVAEGVRLVGGCCGVGPEEITALGRVLTSVR